MNKTAYVYIMANHSGSVIYTGVTSSLIKRVHEHKSKVIPGFTAKYEVNKLVYYEEHSSPVEAITREKQIKAGSRMRKLELVRSLNPEFKDLYPSII